MRIVFLPVLLYGFIPGVAQEVPEDSARILQPVVIQAFATGRSLNEVPASIGHISTSDLQRFSNTSLLPAVNAIAGVRMEERSPGSYRFSIRGSLLRSPFGVRNVKMYWNGLPLTDGGGNTYLNLLDFASVGNIEVIKGPAGSLYGAGTGGVVLLNSPLVKNDQWEFSATVGSYGLRRYQLGQQFHSKKFSLRIQFANQQYGGYREQSAMGRYAVNVDLVVPVKTKGVLSATIFYSSLKYETPGGLTRTQYDTAAWQARPPAGPNRGAVEQQATVYNQTPFVGLSYDHNWNQRWSTRTGFFGSKSDFENPAIRNYEERSEKNFGARTETQYLLAPELKHKITFGAEAQIFSGPTVVSDNNFGEKGNVQTDDDLRSRAATLFGQAELVLTESFFVTLGGSLNLLRYDFTSRQPLPVTEQDQSFKPFFSPRVAVLKKLDQNISWYGNISRGFSPPSLAEVRPSTNAINNSLQPERGINYETGLKGAVVGKLTFDVALYDFRLRETIIVQRLPDGADYFVNAGETSQRGMEAFVAWSPLENGSGFVTSVKVWNSYAYNHYRFEEYINDGNDFSGNKLTGVPPTVNTSGADVVVKRFYANITANYVDHIPLNDLNSAYAEEYFILAARAGFKTSLKKKHPLELFAGINNATDRKFSLGNDLNAVLGGGRYFNAAAPRNYYGGVRITFMQ